MKGKTALYAFLFLVIGLVAGVAANRYWLMPATAPAPTQQLDKLATETRYVCPMHPEIVKNAPGRCPICGMDLVARELHVEHEHEAAPAAATPAGGMPAVTISSAVINNIGVHTLPVMRRTLWREAKMSGYVQGYNPGGKRAVRVPIAGKMSAVHAKPGQWVMASNALFELDVPERMEAQVQHLKLLANNDQAKLEASRQHLRELAFTGPDIEQLEKNGKAEPSLKVYAPQDGRVLEVNFKNGDSITPAAVVVTLQTMGEALVDIDVFQSQVLWLKSGDRAELRIHHLPDQVWKGTVMMEGLRLNSEHRTYGIRLSFAMPEELVKGDMYGEVRIFGSPKKNVLAIPRDALIRAEQSDRVVVALGAGRFQPVKVKTGQESEGWVEVISGLREGQNVVVSAQFLLDSESSMRAEFMRMEAESPDKKKEAPAKQSMETHAMPPADNMKAHH